MENGAGNGDGPHLGDMKSVEDEVLESNGEEEAVLGLHNLKESGGEEMFEEAVEAGIPGFDSDGKLIREEKMGEAAGYSGGSVKVSSNLDDAAIEVDRFEEAIGDSSLVLSSASGVEERAEVLVSEVPPAEVEIASPSQISDADEESAEKEELPASEEATIMGQDKTERNFSNEAEWLKDNVVVENGESELTDAPDEGSTEKAGLLLSQESPIVGQDDKDVFGNEMEEFMEDVAVENSEFESRDADDSSTAIEFKNTIDKNIVTEKPYEVPRELGNDIVHDANMDLVHEDIVTDNQGKQSHGGSGSQDTNEVKGGDIETLMEIESYGSVRHQDANEGKRSDADSRKEIESNGDIMHQDAMNSGMKDLHSIPVAGHQEDRNIKLANNAGSHGSMQKGVGATLEKEIEESKIPGIQGKESEILPPENQEIQGREEDLPAVIVDQAADSTLKGDVSSRASEITESSLVDGSPNSFKDSTVEEGTRSPEDKVSAILSDSSPNEAGKVSLNSSTSAVESSAGSVCQLADANGSVTKPAFDLPDRKAEIEVRDKPSVPSMIGHETNPGTNNPASTVKSPASAPGPLPARPAGLGRAAPLLEPVTRVVQHPRVNGAVSPMQNQLVEEPSNGEAEEYDETREKLQMIRVKFLRLAHRLGQTPHNVVVAQVLYRLGLAEQLRGRNGGRVAAFSFDRASAMAEQLEAAGQEPLDFSCTIMVLGKTGVGKSATINSIFDEVKFGTDAFQLGTKRVQDVVGTVQGIKVRVIDTPGLLPSWSDQRQNEKILHSVKRFIKKTPPDIVLYLDRLDMQSRDFGDMPLLRTITEIFGPSIWFNAIVVLTHAASAPPEGPNGTTTSYDMFVTQRSHAVQQAIRQAAGDMRLMNPVSLVENHSACRTNRAGQRVLPNGQVWKPHLLLLSFASKILAEANTLLKMQDSPPGRPFPARTRAPPLPFLLSSLLQSRPQVKLPTEQFDDDDSIDDMDESSDSEDESEYDQLPPFRSLTKAQLAKLPNDQRKAYYAELEYREKLFMKKQLKEDKMRRKMMKKMQALTKDMPADNSESAEDDSGGAASVPVPMPDLALPASFDSDNPTHRYRCLDSNNQWLVRPVLEPNGWDHDVGYEGINVERLFVVKEKVPVSFSGQVSKDKKDANLQMEVSTSVKHREGKATSLGFDMQSVGKDIAYTLRGETKFSNYRRNKAIAGLSVTILGDVITGGVKVEDKLIINRRGQVVVSGGAMFGRGDVAYGGSLEATLRDKDHPLGRFLSTLGLSVMDWHGDLALGCNSQTQIPIGRHTNLIGRVNINNRGAGQVSIRLNSSEQLQIALIALVPFARKLLGYSQPAQFV